MSSVPRSSSPRSITLGDVGDALVALAATALGLGIGIAVVDGVHADNPAAVVLSALVVAVGDLLLRPGLRVLARAGGAVGALVAGLVAQLLVAWLALGLVPGVHVSSPFAVVGVLVISGLVMAAGRWLQGVNDSEYVVGDVLRRARSRARRRGRAAGAGDGELPPGLLVVQLDGVAAPVLELAIEAGLAPTMARWITSGTHVLDPWWSRVPCTTPASQAGLLHGDSSTVPAFRWWDRELGRLVVTNHPDDAALVEQRTSDGRGLLADGGAAVSTMFSGDATTSLLVMSRARHGLGPGQSYLRFFASPFVLVRAVCLSVGEMIKELYQAQRQRVRGVEPRVSRGGWYVVLRGISNVLLRDLTTSLVAEQVMRAAPVVFVDLVDYDEIAHHAGPTRPEALRALEGLDRVLSVLEQVVAVAPRDYRTVVLSDHGQALGATFAQVEGRSLLDTVRTLMAEPDADAVQAGTSEDWGPLNALLTSARSARPGHDEAVVLGPGAHDRDRHGPTADSRGGAGAGSGTAARDVPDVAVTASGNLGMVWFPPSPRRLVLEEIEDRWPGLVGGLAARPGIGVVVVDTATRGLLAVGHEGLVPLEPAGAPATGTDPLLPYGPRAAADLARVGRLANTGDLIVVSAVGPGGRVHAFEGQVGSHGGLGGDQNTAVLLHPTGWTLDEDLLEDVDGRSMLVGAEQVHRQLKRWLRHAAAPGVVPEPSSPSAPTSPTSPATPAGRSPVRGAR